MNRSWAKTSRDRLRTLYAFLGGDRAGTFTQIDDGVVTFAYDGGYDRTPLSWSLGRAPSPSVASAYLGNLLSDDSRMRQRWARDHDLPDTPPFTLLSAVGEDAG